MLWRAGKVLLLRRSANDKWLPHAWTLPGGYVEAGESAKAAAIRECFEEASISPKSIHLVQKVPTPHCLLHFFSAEAGDGEIKLSPEDDDYAWALPDCLDNYVLAPLIKQAINTGGSL